MKNITKEWIEKAEQYYLVANREFKADPPAYEAVCFNCQQSIEKYLIFKGCFAEKRYLF